MFRAIQASLMLGPLAWYLLAQGRWHGGPGARVVAGQRDHALLWFALAGLIAFGPVAEVLVAWAPRETSWAARVVVLAVLWLGSLLTSPPAHRRLIIFNAPSDLCAAALRRTLAEVAPGRFQKTLCGYEDHVSRCGIAMRHRSWSGTAHVDTYGGCAETLQRDLLARLARHLAPGTHRTGLTASRMWYLLAFLTGVPCLTGLVAGGLAAWRTMDQVLPDRERREGPRKNERGWTGSVPRDPAAPPEGVSRPTASWSRAATPFGRSPRTVVTRPSQGRFGGFRRSRGAALADSS